MWIDSHCHPDDERFAGDRLGLLQRAAAAGVTGLVAIGGGAAPGTLDVGLRVAAGRGDDPALPRVWATAGVHPHQAAEAVGESWIELRRLTADARIIAVGEIGLDYYYDHSPRERQRDVLRRQLAIAAEAGLPVSIHCRDAWDDCLAELEAAPPPAGLVFHCFTGDAAAAERILAQGWYLSFSGILTFPRSAALREIAARAPADRILVETDAPWLAPASRRGRRNEPAWVVETAAVLAAARGWTPEQAARQTCENFFRLFPRARPTATA